MSRIDVRTLFDDLADRRSSTTVRLSRPLDVAPDGGTSYSVPAVAALVREAAGWLAAAGGGPGDRVAVVKDNHWDTVLLTCAAIRIGAVAAPISDRLPAGHLRTLLARLEPAVLVTTHAVLKAARDAGVDLAPLTRRVLCLDQPGTGELTLDDVRGHPSPRPCRRDPDDPLVICHTSGTTGVPKLVVHSERTIIRRLAGFEAHRWPVLGSRPDDTVASATSFVHGRALAWTASVMWLRPRDVLAIADHDPETAAPFLRAHPPTTLEALPATFVRWQPLATGAESPFRRVRLYISTFDAIHPPAVRAFLAATRHRHPVWLQGWGQTETGPLTFRFLTRSALSASGRRDPTTRDLGRPVPLRTRLRVVDPRTLRPVPRGRPGLVLARTRARGLGYVGEPERWTRKTRGAWWVTGDIGVRTRSGGVRLLDREVDTLPDASCLELEDVIDDRIPEVLECVILGVAGGMPPLNERETSAPAHQPATTVDGRRFAAPAQRPADLNGRHPAARHPLPVVVTEDGRLEERVWREAVQDLPPLSAPLLMAWDDLPRTATGKVRRGELRERLLGPEADTHGTGRWT